MLQDGSTVLVGVSGGADSVCLLLLLCEWRLLHPLSIYVVTINHQVREQASEEAEFVRALCEKLNVKYLYQAVDLSQWTTAHKQGLEEAGRSARYQVFHNLSSEIGADCIALAHTASDRAETLLFHLFRGSGLSGLRSILPVRDSIIRPILCLERTEVESYLNAYNQPFCTDLSNYSDDFTRNRIRHHILPAAVSSVSSRAIAHINESATQLHEIEDYLNTMAQASFEKMVRVTSDRITSDSLPLNDVPSDGLPLKSVSIDRTQFIALHPALQKQVLTLVLRKLLPDCMNLSHVHFEALRELFLQANNRALSLPCGFVAKRVYDAVYIESQYPVPRNSRTQNSKDHTPDEQNSEKRLPDSQNARTRTPRALRECAEFRVRTFSSPFYTKPALSCPTTTSLAQSPLPSMQFPQNMYTKWFDCDKIMGCLTVRTRAAGDYLMIKGSQAGQIHHKSLKSFFNDANIPASKRDEILLLAEGSHIVWVIGHRISEYYKISETTRQILEVHYDIVT
ncbi:MAG: tRNA lysidine(34) synthetase TilS [Clostridium sp.]|jgi:tRNA(Ile)-lysidine synthase|nr:tRNA lysidine(34) synthetase TilS [Clostridium sp.]